MFQSIKPKIDKPQQSTKCYLQFFNLYAFMADNNQQQKPIAAQQKSQTLVKQSSPQSKSSANSISQEQPKIKINKNTQIQDRKLDSKKLGLVLYEVAKQQNSVFTQDQKYPLMTSIGGVFFTLCSATLINLSQSILKLDQKKKKIFLLFGAGNLFASLFLGGYSVYKMTDLYLKVPDEKWDHILREKQDYDKLSFSQKRAYLMKDIKADEEKLKQSLIQNEKQKVQEKIELVK